MSALAEAVVGGRRELAVGTVPIKNKQYLRFLTSPDFSHVVEVDPLPYSTDTVATTYGPATPRPLGDTVFHTPALQSVCVAATLLTMQSRLQLRIQGSGGQSM